ncbi:MAG: bifunctional glutamate N-acetyltransferase/amino-acid acetyltransferase ArgJ [Ignavibacteria bacterium]|nr:bifunctional glutamate N-acetyltransferase/amino-acid acetyltransferase ArgJ [Ignavibacteria bacterium]MCU7502673.1 bifunctional glutamate N-acetyltransferase/amino-acid acetyltransferase ArgJ [Ignavibacteria bacterium]MCU7515124.1 bifunctional glutamate N-acetyltransferase/amino-acid acetyltransferase ArgJ [Ignavibacteria bacterium]
MYQFIENGTVTSVSGFKAAGIHCGIKKKKKDLALIYSELPCSAAGTFTINKVKAAPLLISKKAISGKKTVKAVLVNSGNANACTGSEGYNDAKITRKHCAELLGIKPSEVLVSSTGVIGKRLPMDTFLQGINKIVPHLSEEGGLDAAQAIMTTDKKMKSYALKVKLEGGSVKIGAICKGSGMIMPNMATMLAFITTDAKVSQATLQKILKKSVQNSFNKISVDGETSTNDMVVLLANGQSEISIKAGSKNESLFQEALDALTQKMARTIASDGEGATKLITVNVTGAKTDKDANLVGKSVANSALVKTAMYGRDANWGRIMSAAGMSGAKLDPEKMSISFANVPVLLPGYKIVLDEAAALEVLSKDEVEININLASGKKSSTWWTCDFTEEYIKINADYRT